MHIEWLRADDRADLGQEREIAEAQQEEAQKNIRLIERDLVEMNTRMTYIGRTFEENRRFVFALASEYFNRCLEVRFHQPWALSTPGCMSLRRLRDCHWLVQTKRKELREVRTRISRMQGQISCAPRSEQPGSVPQVLHERDRNLQDQVKKLEKRRKDLIKWEANRQRHFESLERSIMQDTTQDSIYELLVQTGRVRPMDSRLPVNETRRHDVRTHSSRSSGEIDSQKPHSASWPDDDDHLDDSQRQHGSRGSHRRPKVNHDVTADSEALDLYRTARADLEYAENVLGDEQWWHRSRIAEHLMTYTTLTVRGFGQFVDDIVRPYLQDVQEAAATFQEARARLRSMGIAEPRESSLPSQSTPDRDGRLRVRGGDSDPSTDSSKKRRRHHRSLKVKRRRINRWNADAESFHSDSNNENAFDDGLEDEQRNDEENGKSSDKDPGTAIGNVDSTFPERRHERSASEQ